MCKPHTTPKREHYLANGKSTEACRYVVSVSDKPEDPAWDAFLKENFHGSHVQSSLWAKVKTWSGWRTTRIVVSDGNRIVAGAQLLVRKASFLGSIGYIPKGPVFVRHDPALTELVIKTVRQVAAAQTARIILVQPSQKNESLDQHLHESGFRRCPIETSPTATVLVDLKGDLATILARMKKGMRNGIRRSQRKGIKVREGTLDDLPTFHRLLVVTSKRHGFTPFDLDYFLHLWRTLSPAGHLRLFLSEYEGEPVSAQLVIPFGNKVIAKQIGWSREHGHRKPNEGLDWATIQWAKAHGYRYYDLEGIEPEAARAILNGQPLPESFAQTATSYKLRLGGEIHLFADTYCYISNPFLRGAYNLLGYRVAKWQRVQEAAHRFRTY